MAAREFLKGCLLLVILVAVVNSASTGSFVISTEAAEESDGNTIESALTSPEIYEMFIQTNVTNRYAKTLITSKVKNEAQHAREAIFFVVLPEKAFISEFVMEIGGKSYKAYVKEKEEAKDIYDQAVRSGQSAAHVAVSARDSNKFTVSLNIEPESKAVFKLTYEEFLQRQKGYYEIVLNIHPGQIIRKLDVEVLIEEAVPLTFVRTPLLRSGNEIGKNDDILKPNTEIITINSKSSIVKFHPDTEEQKRFAHALDTKESEGLKGQFVVEYDVERNVTGGEVLLNDGYFIHFFAPDGLKHLPKNIVFVLDISGSMMGTKISQLIDAMIHILGDLKPIDSFSIVAFSTDVEVWSIESENFISLGLGRSSNYGSLADGLKGKMMPEPIAATVANVNKAKNFIKNIRPLSLTNIIGGLEVGIIMLNKALALSQFYQPLLVFLTDGHANVGLSSSDSIIKTVATLNPKGRQAPIFSLSFGGGADKDFLRKLSTQNLGFSRHIYEGADASLQLQDFYKLISSPLLKDVSFKYTKNATMTTKDRFPIFFKGSEFIVAGKIPTDPQNEFIVEGHSSDGSVELKPKIIESEDSLEKLWAFLAVRQILDEREVADNKSELTKKAVELALKYSFVTPVTSLVVVKPNDTSAVDAEQASLDIAFRGSSNSRYGGSYYGSTTPYSFNLRGGSRISSGNDLGNRFHTTSYDLRSDSVPKRFQLQTYGIFSGNDLGNRFHTTSYDLRSDSVPKGFQLQTYGLNNPWDDSDSKSLSTISTFDGNQPLAYIPMPSSAGPTQKLPVPLPELQKQDWFKLLMNDKFSIKFVDDYKLATNETVVTKKPCSKTISNKPGTCTLIHQCPRLIPFLIDISSFVRYFCPLEGYAGVCCDE